MRKLLALAEEALAADEQCVLCSVVRLEGSGYGRVGARLLVTESGDREGYISGAAVWRRTFVVECFMKRPLARKLMTFDTRGNAVVPTRYNAGCEGVVYVLCQPVKSLESHPFLRISRHVIQRRHVARLLTVYRAQWDGISAGDALVQSTDLSTDPEHPIEFTTCSEAWSQRLASLLPAFQGSFTATLRGTESQAIDFLVETIEPPRRLVIFGAGDDVKPVVQVGIESGWEVCVVGKDPAFANNRRFPGAQVVCGDFATLARALVADQFTHVISMSHDFASDLQLLPALLESPPRSIGLLGSKRRLAKLLKALLDRGQWFHADRLACIRSPIGLDIGAETPAEIALSIVAELLAIDRGRRVRA